jgi:hypothetical protein
VPQNYTEAARWYLKAAELGDMAAEVYLAGAYRRGQGVPRNYVQAARWFLEVIGPITLHSERRQGWTTLVALLSLVASLVVSRGRWGLPGWLSSAFISFGGAVYVLHLALRPQCCWPGRTFGIAFFATISVAYAYAAVAEALRARKSSAGPDQPPTPPADGTVSAA